MIAIIAQQRAQCLLLSEITASFVQTCTLFVTFGQNPLIME